MIQSAITTYTFVGNLASAVWDMRLNVQVMRAVNRIVQEALADKNARL